VFGLFKKQLAFAPLYNTKNRGHIILETIGSVDDNEGELVPGTENHIKKERIR